MKVQSKMKQSYGLLKADYGTVEHFLKRYKWRIDYNQLPASYVTAWFSDRQESKYYLSRNIRFNKKVVISSRLLLKLKHDKQLLLS